MDTFGKCLRDALAVDPAANHQLRHLPGNFSGLHLLCLPYVAFQLMAPKHDIGFDFSKEYAAAQKLFRKKSEGK